MNNIISKNITPQGWSSGGGIGCDECPSPVIANNILFGNWAHYGGGISIGGDDWTMTNNTIFGNTAATEGGGMGCYAGTATIANTVLWNNDSPIGPELTLSVSSILTLSHSDVEGGKSSVYIHSGCTLIWSSGMIDSDPLFVGEANGDFHLTFPSPCKDTGDNSIVTEPTDFEGDPRIAYGTVDMGADEFYTHLYWTGDATPGGNVELKFVGLPGTAPVQLWLGSGVLDPPWSTKYGDWYLQFPLLATMPNLGTIPSDGVYLLSFTVPPDTPTPLILPFQAGIGQELSNLSVMDVK